MTTPIADDDAEALSQYERLERRRGLRLRFPRAMEQRYIADRIPRALTLQRFSMFCGMIGYALYFAHELINQGPLAQRWYLIAVLGLFMPANLALAVTTYLPRARSRIPAMAIMVATVNSLFMAVALGVLRGESGFELNEALILQSFYNFSLLGLLYRVAMPLSFGMVALLLLSELFTSGQLPPWDQNFFLFIALAVGSASCFLQERVDRRDWLRGQLLKELSERDSLTGLHNRRSFLKHCQQMMRQAKRDERPISMLLIDVDYFKRFNDSYGHPAGDACLQKLAMLLQNAARRPLDMAARLGGEEFAVLLYGAPEDAALERAGLLCRQIAESNVAATTGLVLRITASIGIATQAADQKGTIRKLIGAADIALYQAKKLGRNRVESAVSEI